MISLSEQRALVDALSVLARAAECVSDENLRTVVNAYNHVHRRLDGRVVPQTSFSRIRI